MNKYETKSWCEGGYWNLEDTVITTSECIVEDEKFSGLYNDKGEPLYKVKQRIGYI